MRFEYLAIASHKYESRIMCASSAYPDKNNNSVIYRQRR